MIGTESLPLASLLVLLVSALRLRPSARHAPSDAQDLTQVTELIFRNENFRVFWAVVAPLCRRKFFAVGRPTGVGSSASLVVKTFSL